MRAHTVLVGVYGFCASRTHDCISFRGMDKNRTLKLIGYARVSSSDQELRLQLGARAIGFKSICDGAIDTTRASGELIFNVFASLAQFERRLIQERTNAGLAAARARGRNGGRPPIPVDHPSVVTAKKMHADKTMPVADICRTLRI